MLIIIVLLHIFFLTTTVLGVLYWLRTKEKLLLFGTIGLSVVAFVIVPSLNVICLALSGAAIAVFWYWLKTKKKKYLFWSVGLASLTVVLPLFMIGITELIVVFPRFFDKDRIIELNKFESFSGKNLNDNYYYYTVLINDPPENPDSLKKMMAGYFINKAAYVDSIDPSAYLGNIRFYKYTRKTAYFIDHDEDPGGFSSNTLDMYEDQYMGSILRDPSECDSSKYYDRMLIYMNGNIIKDTLRWECGDRLIGNWEKYK